MSVFRAALAKSWLLALLPAAWTAWPLWRETPLSHDHPTHLFKAWHFWTQMLAQGRMRGWSHFWGFGFPSDELVPCGGELWVAAFRALTLGQLEWTRTYALSFAAFLLFKSFATYAFTRRYFGRAAGVLAAWIMALDPGAFSEGGWVWNVDWGVWPVSLSMSFTLLAFERLEAVLERGRARDVFLSGACVGAALLAHQLALFVFAVACPLFLLEHGLRSRRPSWERLAQVFGALTFGVGLAAFTIVPFLTRTKYTFDLGASEEPLSKISERVLALGTFSNVLPAISGLSLVGGWLAIRSGARGRVFVTGTAATFVFLSSDFLTSVLHLERALPSLIKIEAPRMLLVAKLFWFPLAAYALVRIAGWAARERRPEALWSRLLGWGLVFPVTAALVVPGLPHLYATQIAKELQGESTTPNWADYQELFAWSRALHAASPDEHYRIAYDVQRGNHVPTMAAVYDQTLIYRIGETPSQIFNNLPMGDGPGILEAASVKYVVSDRDLANPKLAYERSFGGLRLYRFTGHAPQPFAILGQGQAELVEFSPERLRIRLSGTAPDSRLEIHVAAYDRWQATLSGAMLPITTVTVHGAEDPVLMEVPVARDGELVLAYVNRAPDWLGLILSLAAVPAFVAIAMTGRARFAPIIGWLERSRGRLGWTALAALLLAAAFVARRALSRASLLPRDSIFYQLQGPELTLAGQPCSKVDSLSFECGAYSVRADLVHGRGDHLCMTAPDVGELRLHAPVALGDFITGRYDAEPGPGSIRVALDGEMLGTLHTRPPFMLQQFFQFDTRQRPNRTGMLELSIRGGALSCFDVGVPPPRPR